MKKLRVTQDIWLNGSRTTGVKWPASQFWTKTAPFCFQLCRKQTLYCTFIDCIFIFFLHLQQKENPHSCSMLLSLPLQALLRPAHVPTHCPQRPEVASTLPPISVVDFCRFLSHPQVDLLPPRTGSKTIIRPCLCGIRKRVKAED